MACVMLVISANRESVSCNTSPLHPLLNNKNNTICYTSTTSTLTSATTSGFINYKTAYSTLTSAGARGISKRSK